MGYVLFWRNGTPKNMFSNVSKETAESWLKSAGYRILEGEKRMKLFMGEDRLGIEAQWVPDTPREFRGIKVQDWDTRPTGRIL